MAINMEFLGVRRLWRVEEEETNGARVLHLHPSPLQKRDLNRIVLLGSPCADAAMWGVSTVLSVLCLVLPWFVDEQCTWRLWGATCIEGHRKQPVSGWFTLFFALMTCSGCCVALVSSVLVYYREERLGQRGHASTVRCEGVHERAVFVPCTLGIIGTVVSGHYFMLSLSNAFPSAGYFTSFNLSLFASVFSCLQYSKWCLEDPSYTISHPPDAEEEEMEELT